MTTGAEIPGNIINALRFYDPTQRITIATLLKKKKQRKVISVLKEEH